MLYREEDLNWHRRVARTTITNLAQGPYESECILCAKFQVRGHDPICWECANNIRIFDAQGRLAEYLTYKQYSPLPMTRYSDPDA